MAAATLIALIPSTSGIYWIRCKRNGKIYVGSAVNLRQRWDRHRRALRDKIHHNAPLQQAWNLYGEENFEFEILEHVAEADLLRAEQEWIDRTDCTHRKIGFNICALASSQGRKDAAHLERISRSRRQFGFNRQSHRILPHAQTGLPFDASAGKRREQARVMHA